MGCETPDVGGKPDLAMILLKDRRSATLLRRGGASRLVALGANARG
jgi:hypothetical protein